MSTVSKFHRSGLGVLSVVVGLCFLVVFAQRVFATVHPDMDCWLVDTGSCNTPSGDCQWKPDNMVCFVCDGTAPLNSACIYRLYHTCETGAVGAMCGNKFRGRCDNGLCDANVLISDMCAVFACEGPVPK